METEMHTIDYEPFHIQRLQEADRYVRQNHPDWDGDETETVGITAYSKAKWYRNRGMRSQVNAVLCYENKEGNCCVELLDEKGKLLLTLAGMSWGYGGEGPNGLACVLADIFPEKFPNQRTALEEVARHPMNETWTVRRGDE
jgi:hypothetical protein